MSTEAHLESFYLFDDYGMPAGRFGYEVYRDLLCQVSSQVAASDPEGGSALYEVLTPRATRQALDAEGIDLPGIPTSSPADVTVGVYVRRRSQSPEVGLADIWGFEPSPEVGALILARSSNPTVEPVSTGLQVALVSRAGFRGVLVENSAARVHLEVTGPLEPPPAFFGSMGLLLERAVQAAPSPIAPGAVVSVAQFIAAEAVHGTLDALEAARSDGIDDPAALYLLAFASSLVRTFRLAVELGGGSGEARVAAMKDVLHHIRASPGDISARFADLHVAIGQCAEVAHADWTVVLRRPSARELLTPLLPSPVLDNPEWGGSQLIGYMLGAARKPESALRGLAGLPEDQRDIVLELLAACRLDLPES